MSDSESAIDTIYSILEHGFERHIIEDFYEAHNQDMERTLNALMNLSLEEREGLQQNQTIGANIYGELERVGLNPIRNLSDDNEDNSALLPELEHYTSILNGLVNMFEDQISSSKLQKLLLEVIQENVSISNEEELSARAADSIMSHIAIVNLTQMDQSEKNQFDDDVIDIESFEIPEVNLKRDYNLFVCMFSGVIKDNRMKKLWKQSMESCLGKMGSNTKELSESEQDDVMDVAVIMAMEFMDTAERKCRDANISADSQLAASLAAEDGYVYNPPPPPSEAELSGYNIDEEQEYYSGLSTQQAALQFVKMLLGDEFATDGRRITDQQIEQALEACNYDVEECIDQLQNSSTQSSGKAATLSSSSKSVKNQPVVPVSYKQSVSSKQPAAAVGGGTLFATSGKQQSFLPIVGPPQKMVYRSFRDRSGYVNMNEDLALHFLGTLKKKNGHVKARLGEDRRAIIFEGVTNVEKLLTNHPSRGVNNVDKYNASHVAVDLHNLGMDVAVQVVDSALTYFLTYIRDYNQRSNFKGYKLVVKFIVGKGLHSPGGVPKIGPAVLSYLANERKELVSCLVEGMIYVTCI
jgi:hypothetical protein